MNSSRNKNKDSSLPLFRKEALEAQGQRLFGDVIIIQPVAFKVFTLLFSSILIVVLVFLIFGGYSKKETVNGFLMPDKGISKIYVPQPGVVTELFIGEGQRVKAGDPLFKITFEKAMNSGGGMESQIIQFLEEQIRMIDRQLVEEADHSKITEQQLKEDIETFEFELGQLEQRLTLQEQMTKDADEGLKIAEELAKDGYLTKLELQRRKNSFLTFKSTEATILTLIEQVKNSLRAKRADLAKHPFDVEHETNRLKAQKSELNQRLTQVKGQRSLTVTSPISGTISTNQVFIGSSVAPAIPQMTILPEGSSLRAELYVPTRAIGLIKPGQEVRIFYDAFRYQSFGTYLGSVSEISKTILRPDEINSPLSLEEPVYRVIATLAVQKVEGFGETFPLQAGMTLQAVIILEDQTFFEMILEPLSALKGRT